MLENNFNAPLNVSLERLNNIFNESFFYQYKETLANNTINNKQPRRHSI